MAVTKLVQWVLGVGAFMCLWVAYMLGVLAVKVPTPCHQVLQVLPLYLLMTFACYSLGAVGYRVATFNDCVEASKELQQQIQEARADLKRKGFKHFDD